METVLQVIAVELFGMLLLGFVQLFVLMTMREEARKLNKVML